jgi:DNA gyrase/topoisomerase IV subunit B
MYVGDTADGSGMHDLIWEVIGNVVDLHLARNATELRMDVAPDGWITVRDDGPGISVAPAQGTTRTVLEDVFTSLHTGPTYDGHTPHVHVSTSLQGFGLAVANALSARLEVETTRDGVRWAQAYERGLPVTAVRRLGATSIEGTSIRFRPDPEIFGAVAVDVTHVRERLQQIAWLNPLLRVMFQDHRLPGRGGLRTWVEQVATARGPFDALYSTHAYSGGVFVDVAVGWASSAEPMIRSFVNVRETLSGTHVIGLWRGFSEYAHRLGTSARGTEAVRTALEPGLVAILHVGLYSPAFGGPTFGHLISPTAGKAVRQVLEADLPIAVQHDARLATLLHGRLGIKPARRGRPSASGRTG